MKSINNFYKIVGYSILALSLIIGLYTRLFTYDNFVSFGQDQIRDAEVYALMKLGTWPALGPIAPLTDDLGFYLFPLYHYLVGTFTLNSNNLNLQLLINGIFSFLSVPLFIMLNYRLLENIKPGIRFILASLAGLWFSIFVSDIVNANLAWNPSPMLFFVFLFFLLVDKLNKVKDHVTFIEHFLLWITLGIVTAFLISLHTWSMIVFIPAFLINCIYFSILYIKKETHRKTIYPFIGLVYLLMFLSTYIASEIGSNWENTNNMFEAVYSSSSAITTSFSSILSRPFVNIVLMVERAYIVEPSLYLIALPFVTIIICFFAFNFKGNKFLIWQILITVLLYSIGIANFPGEIKSRYQILIWYLPIVLCISALAYTPKYIFLKTFQIFYTLLFMGISVYFNWIYTKNFMMRVYGSTKLIDTDEMIDILSSLPARSKICYPWGAGYDYLPQLQFIDSYITNKNHKFENNCLGSDYYIYLKNLPNTNSDYATHKNIQRFKTSIDPISEGLSFTVYKVEK